MAKNTKKPSSAETAESNAAVGSAMTITYESIVEAFKKKVSLSKAPVDARVAAQVKLYGCVEGTLYVLIANGIAVVEPFDYRGADIEIDADADVFNAVLSGKKAISNAIADGDIKMQGNAGKAIVLAASVF